MSAKLGIETRLHAGDGAILLLTGRLEVPLEGTLVRRIEDLAEDGRTKIVVDLGGLDYLNSRGVSAFIAAVDQLRARGGDLKLAGVKPQAAMILGRLGISRIVQQFGTVDEAIGAFSTPIEEFMTGQGLDWFVASTRGGSFHASGCVQARRIRERAVFVSKKEARGRGFKPCRRCCPDPAGVP